MASHGAWAPMEGWAAASPPEACTHPKDQDSLGLAETPLCTAYGAHASLGLQAVLASRRAPMACGSLPPKKALLCLNAHLRKEEKAPRPSGGPAIIGLQTQCS